MPPGSRCRSDREQVVSAGVAAGVPAAASRLRAPREPGTTGNPTIRTGPAARRNGRWASHTRDSPSQGCERQRPGISLRHRNRSNPTESLRRYPRPPWPTGSSRCTAPDAASGEPGTRSAGFSGHRPTRPSTTRSTECSARFANTIAAGEGAGRLARGMILSRGLTMVAAGLALGALGGVAVGRALGGHLYGVAPPTRRPAPS